MAFSVIVFFVFKNVLLFAFVEFLYAISGDMLLLDSIKTVPWRRAVVDNLFHISLGIISWFVAVVTDKIMFQPLNIACSLLCGFFAGFVDIDHFLMAKSLKLSDVLNLPSRPPFHNSTLMLICILSFIYIMHLTACVRAAYIGWILLVAVISHHLRDSLHRGLWLWPIHTKPIGRLACVGFTYCLPLVIGGIVRCLYKRQKHLVGFNTLNV